ncbi:MAG: hypothetical protein K0S74_1654 [Chlamydiales bacterium]|jgi:flagellar biogenesis protein FliO|nr:hypothetical protein [Chlamydiales bacterium]
MLLSKMIYNRCSKISLSCITCLIALCLPITYLYAQEERVSTSIEKITESSTTPPTQDKISNNTTKQIPSPSLEQAEDYNFTTGLIRIASTLMFIIFLILLSAWILRRITQTRVQQLNESNVIKLVSQRALSPKTNIYLIEVLGKGIIVSESATGVQHLADIDLNKEKMDLLTPSKTEGQKNFRQIMEKMLQTKPNHEE